MKNSETEQYQELSKWYNERVFNWDSDRAAADLGNDDTDSSGIDEAILVAGMGTLGLEDDAEGVDDNSIPWYNVNANFSEVHFVHIQKVECLLTV